MRVNWQIVVELKGFCIQVKLVVDSEQEFLHSRRSPIILYIFYYRFLVRLN